MLIVGNFCYFGISRKLIFYKSLTFNAEAKQSDTFKDPIMLKRLNDITNLPESDKEHILCTLDHLLASVKN